MDIVLYFSRPIDEFRGAIELPDCARIWPDRRDNGRWILPERFAHLLDRFTSTGWITAAQREEQRRQQHQAQLAEIEFKEFPMRAADIVRHARDHRIGLELRGGKLFVNAPDGMDMTFAKCLQYRRREVIEEIERREKCWTEVV